MKTIKKSLLATAITLAVFNTHAQKIYNEDGETHFTPYPAATAGKHAATGQLATYRGAEFNPSGQPIGGGVGYDKPLTNLCSDGDSVTYTVTTVDDLKSKLGLAKCGDIVLVDTDSTLDVPADKRPIEVPAGVILAGNRGKDGKLGALLRVTASKATTYYDPLIVTEGASARITGLRLQGPCETRTCDSSNLTTAVLVRHSDAEVDNNEIYNWSHAGVSAFVDRRLKGLKDSKMLSPHRGDNLYVHHNSIHHVHADGQGYGVGVNGTTALIEGNHFDYNRHSIASTGEQGTGYEVRYNVFGDNHTSYLIDAHGVANRHDGTDEAGDWFVVHHNSFHQSWYPTGAILLNGTPRTGAWIFNNWLKPHNSTTPVITYGEFNHDPARTPSQSSDFNDGGCIDAQYGTGVRYACSQPIDFDNHPYADRSVKSQAKPDSIFVFNNLVSENQWGKNRIQATEPMFAGDFDGDGLVDLMQVDNNGYINIARNSGFSGYPKALSWETTGVAGITDYRRLRVADFNADGVSDIAMLKSDGKIKVWHASNTKGVYTFSAAKDWGTFDGNIEMTRFHLGDFNGDNRADLIAFTSDNKFTVWPSNTTGESITGVAWGSNGADLGLIENYHIADLNNDGLSDVVSFEASLHGQTLVNGFRLWSAKPGGGFNGYSTLGWDSDSQAGNTGIRYTFGDLNDDGKTKIYSMFGVAPSLSGSVWRMLGHNGVEKLSSDIFSDLPAYTTPVIDNNP